MKYQTRLFAVCFASWVAATLAPIRASGAGITPEDNSYGEIDLPEITDGNGNIVYDGGQATLASLSDFTIGLGYWKTYIAQMRIQWSEAKAAFYKANALWEATDALARGLQRDLNDNFTKKTDFDEHKKNAVTKTSLATDIGNAWYSWKYLLDDYITKSTYDSDKSKNETAHNEIKGRLEKLENRPIGGGGAGCGEDCKTSIRRLSEYLGDSLTVAESGSTGSCVTVTANGTLFDSVLNKLPICYYGSVFEVGSSAPKQIFEDAELTIPAFGAADIWAGEGLEAALPIGPTVKKQLNVKVKNPGDFNAKSLAQILDGDTTKQNADGVAYADVSGVAAVDGEGHLRLIEIGSASFGIDDHTIVREKKEADQEDSPLVLKAKIANMVDGDTIVTDGEGGAAKAKVNVDALCDDETIETSASDTLQVRTAGIVDDDTIGVNDNGKLYVKSSGGLDADDVTLTTVDVSGEDGATSKQMAIKGFAEAGANTMPYKTEDGTLLWGTLLGTNTVILAGAGINVTANGEGAITISAQALSDSPSGSSGGETASLTVVTAVRYDETTHKFQQKSRTITFKGSVGDESDWTDVFEAVSHKSEHETEASE